MEMKILLLLLERNGISRICIRRKRIHIISKVVTVIGSRKSLNIRCLPGLTTFLGCGS